LLIGATHVCR